MNDIQREDALRLAIDAIPALVLTSLPGGHIDYLNQRWLDFTGLKQSDACGWGWQEAVHSDDLPGLVTHWRSILTAGEPGQYEVRLRRFDGEYRWFLFRGVPISDEHGQITKWYGTNVDVDALRASEHVARGQLETRPSADFDAKWGGSVIDPEFHPARVCGPLMYSGAPSEGDEGVPGSTVKLRNSDVADTH